MSKKRVLITAGGTGGHLYPAQGLAQQIMKQSPSHTLLFVAGGLSNNRYFDRNLYSFQEIPCSPLLSKNPLKCLKGVFNLIIGISQSIAILKRYQPDVVVGFGSYYTVPILLAAKLVRIPIVLHEANSIPGRANKWLACLAASVGVHFPETTSFFKGKSIEVGLPLREGYSLGAVSKEEALSYFGLSSQFRTLLISGGSQGAQAINKLVSEALPYIKKLSLQVIHLTGNEDSAKTLASLYATQNIPCSVKPFEKQMHMAWSAADVFIGRSGASTIAESIEFEIPTILIPYPYATDNHQEKNADFLIKQVGSACKLLEKESTAKKLGVMLESFFQNDQFQVYKRALKAYKQRPHQMTLSQLILKRF